MSYKAKGIFRGKKVGVLMGGPSGERPVSLRSGQAVIKALESLGYCVIGIDAQNNLLDVLKKEGVEVVYNALHGTWGEDGLVQGLLETARIPYSGSGVGASALTMNKVLTKKLLLQENISTPNYRLIPRKKASVDPDAWAKEIPFPWVIKPASEGSSLGISISKRREDVAKGLELAFRYDDREVLVEEFIAGREMTVGLVDCDGENPLVFPVVEIVSKREFYDYQAKYTPGQSEYFCPAKIPETAGLKMQKMAQCVHEITGCRGGVRVDFRLNPQNHPFVIEINTSPGMTELSLLPMGAKAHGLSFADLVESILDTAKTEVSLNWN